MDQEMACQQQGVKPFSEILLTLTYDARTKFGLDVLIQSW